MNVVVAKSGIAKHNTEEPKFTAPIGNVTTPLGREAVLSCTVDHIAKYKVSYHLCTKIRITTSLVADCVDVAVVLDLDGIRVAWRRTRHRSQPTCNFSL